MDAVTEAPAAAVAAVAASVSSSHECLSCLDVVPLSEEGSADGDVPLHGERARRVGGPGQADLRQRHQVRHGVDDDVVCDVKVGISSHSEGWMYSNSSTMLRSHHFGILKL